MIHDGFFLAGNAPALELIGRGLVRPGTVYALGRNYAEHAAEMNAPAEPVVFLKPATALLPGGGVVPWPCGAAVVHHEVELTLLLGGGGADLDREAARRAIAGIGIGVDLTARDLQDEAKRKSQPWARSKGFPGAAPVSAFVDPAALGGSFVEIDLALTVDGALRQSDTAASMILDPAETVAALSRWFDLRAGDVVFTGTPKGVGPIERGQQVVARSRRLGLEVGFTMA